MATPTLKEAIDKVWQIQGEWHLITLGKGYFNIQLPTTGEYDRIFKRRSWQTEFGLLGLQRWTPEFNPYKLASPLVNVWVHIYEIQQEYFHEHIIEAIASVLGPVVSMDQRTKDGTMCHYARVLVELDLCKEKEHYIMFERSGHCSIASVGYEPHPDFCNFCQVVGHSLNACRSKDRDRPKNDTSNKDAPPKEQDGTVLAKKWTKKDNPTPTTTAPATHTVELGDRHPEFELVPYYTTTSEAMQVTGHDLPHASPTCEKQLVEQDQIYNKSNWEIPRKAISPLKISGEMDKPNTSNSFSAIDPMSEGHTASEEEETEDVEDFTNDPLEEGVDEAISTVKKRGRPKKGEERTDKKTMLIKNYNTRQRPLVSEEMATTTSISSTKFQVNDEALEGTGMKTTFKSWADECDSTNILPPKHSNK